MSTTLPLVRSPAILNATFPARLDEHHAGMHTNSFYQEAKINQLTSASLVDSDDVVVKHGNGDDREAAQNKFLETLDRVTRLLHLDIPVGNPEKMNAILDTHQRHLVGSIEDLAICGGQLRDGRYVDIAGNSLNDDVSVEIKIPESHDAPTMDKLSQLLFGFRGSANEDVHHSKSSEGEATFASILKGEIKKTNPSAEQLKNGVIEDRLKNEAGIRKFHGKAGLSNPDWKMPKCVMKTEKEARPGYQKINASEYRDDAQTRTAKLKVVVQMLRNSKATVVYTGAGLSTAAGIGDYASKGEKSIAPHKKMGEVGSRLALSPTYAHHCLSAMHYKGWFHHWVQQNHDRLPQKAGYPQADINEIHGAWGDHKNPVVAMTGSLRKDMVEWLEEWKEKVQVCIAMGTSLCGMNADSVCEEAADRDGLIIIGIAPTGKDSRCAVRIWGLLDEVLEELCGKDHLNVGAVPLPVRKQQGDRWVQSHPNCRFDTPMRTKSHKEETALEVEKRIAQNRKRPTIGEKK